MIKTVAKAVFVYLTTNKKARALEYALVLGVIEAARSALGFGA